jgi:hypothetical protein
VAEVYRPRHGDRAIASGRQERFTWIEAAHSKPSKHREVLAHLLGCPTTIPKWTGAALLAVSTVNPEEPPLKDRIAMVYRGLISGYKS